MYMTESDRPKICPHKAKRQKRLCVSLRSFSNNEYEILKSRNKSISQILSRLLYLFKQRKVPESRYLTIKVPTF